MKSLSLITLIAVLLTVTVAVFAQDTDEDELDCPAFADSSTDVRIGYYMGEGIAYESSGQLAEAIYSYSCIIEQIDESYIPAYINRALIHTTRRSFDLAIEDYTTILDIDSSVVGAINNRGLVHMARQEYDEAISDFEDVINTDTSYIPGYVNRGAYHAIQGDYELALEDFQTVVDLAELEPVVEWYNTPEEDEDGNPIDKGEIPDYEREYARVYAMMGFIDALQALDDYSNYLNLAGNTADRRVESAAGELRSRFQFDLRFDDGTWVIFEDFVEPEEDME